jgi:parallel beta-helix repeat protein
VHHQVRAVETSFGPPVPIAEWFQYTEPDELIAGPEGLPLAVAWWGQRATDGFSALFYNELFSGGGRLLLGKGGTRMDRRHWLIAPLLGLGLLVTSLWLLADSANGQVAATTVRTVCPAGPPQCNFRTVQAAVDAARADDVIKVAAGTYTDVHARPRYDVDTMGVVTQVVYIRKPLTLRGGYTATDFSDPPDPVLNVTTLDAQGQGRVLYIASAGETTVEGFTITGGYAKRLLGDAHFIDEAGGGVFVMTSTVTLGTNQVVSNTATEQGGGLYISWSTAALTDNTITANRTLGHAALGCCPGGGMLMEDSTATFTGNVISDNYADTDGGLAAYRSTVNLVDNTISHNGALHNGGGVSILFGDTQQATLIHNRVTDNAGPNGGVLVWWQSHVLLVDNTITDNHTYGLVLSETDAEVLDNTIAENTYGGVAIMETSGTTLAGNTITDNGGHGVAISSSGATLAGNIITGNVSSRGGGVYISNRYAPDSTPILVNNLIADNQATIAGSGLYLDDSSLLLLHTTVARNTGGDSSGICVQGTPGGITLTNTILVSHTLGITVSAGANVAMDGVLWFDNGTNVAGAGTVTFTHAITGDPAFAADGYHLLAGSAAIDAGVDAHVTDDIDGQPRPYQAPDLGADEYWPPGALPTVYLPVVFRSE